MAKIGDKRSLKDWEDYKNLISQSTEVDGNETESEKKKRIERLKKDYKAFIEYYFPSFATAETPDFHIKSVNRVKRRKSIFLWRKWGRGLSKSVVSDLTETIFEWINGNTKFILIVGQNQTKANLLLEDLRVQFECNQRLINDFGPQHNPGNWENGFFKTKSGFIGMALGMGQDPRGIRIGPLRPDRIICDDWETKETVKNPKRQDEYANWLLTSLIPTIDGADCKVILAQNQSAPRMIFSKIVEENEGWIVEDVKAFDPVTLEPNWKSKYGKGYYAEKVRVMGTINANAEYNNEPHVEGKLFTDSMIQWTKLPRLDHFDKIIGTWDVAFAGSKTSDFNAVRVWGIKDGLKYLINCYVKRSKIRPAVEWIADFQKSTPKGVFVKFWVEKQFLTDEVDETIEDVEEETGVFLNISTMSRSTVNKYDRIESMHPTYQNGKVYYNEKLKNHNDTKEGLAQLKGIEPGYSGNDDAPDADQYAFEKLDKFKKRKKKRKFVIGARSNRKF